MDINVKEAIDRIAQLSEVTIADVERKVDGSVPVVAMPTGSKIESLKKFFDEYAAKPDRRVGTDKLQDLDTMVAWLNRNKDAGTVVFCDSTREAPKMLAVVDYHHIVTTDEESRLPMSGDDKARFGKFRGLYEFPLSAKWNAWRAVDDKFIDQATFAEFLDDHALDLIAPESGTDSAGNDVQRLPDEVAQYLSLLGGRCALPADVIALAKGLDVTAKAKHVTRVDVQTGAGALVFDEEHIDSKGTRVDVPKIFMIALPLFDRSPFHYRVPVRIRYRLGPPLVWKLTMFRPDQIIDEAIKDAAQHVREKAAVTVFLGTPSA